MTKKYSLGIVGRKAGMSRLFTEDGKSVPVTLIEATPNRITQVKTLETDGYSAVQVVVGTRRAALINKPSAGHLAKAKVEGGRGLWELRVEADKIGAFEGRRRDQGRHLRGRPDCRRRGHHQGQGLPRARSSAGTSRWRRDARQLAVASFTWLHRPTPDAGPRVSGQEDVRAHGFGPANDAAPAGGQGRRRAWPDCDQGRGARRSGRRRDRSPDEQGSLMMELAINNSNKDAVCLGCDLWARIQPGSRPSGGRCVPQCGPRRHQGAEDAFGSQRHHQEIKEAEGRRRATWRIDSSDLRRRRRDIRRQATQLRAEGHRKMYRAAMPRSCRKLNRQAGSWLSKGLTLMRRTPRA